MLEVNVQSLAAQTCANYEQVFITDPAGQGLHAANKSLALAQPAGEYVMILDDDDELIDPDALAILARAIEDMDEPDLLFFRADHAANGVLPDSRVWGKRPRLGHVGSCDFITRRAVWERHIAAFGQPRAGDYAYLMAVWGENPAVAWLDVKLAAVQRISNGRPE